jgi:hypothetical protein
VETATKTHSNLAGERERNDGFITKDEAFIFILFHSYNNIFSFFTT